MWTLLGFLWFLQLTKTQGPFWDSEWMQGQAGLTPAPVTPFSRSNMSQARNHATVQWLCCENRFRADVKAKCRVSWYTCSLHTITVHSFVPIDMKSLVLQAFRLAFRDIFWFPHCGRLMESSSQNLRTITDSIVQKARWTWAHRPFRFIAAPWVRSQKLVLASQKSALATLSLGPSLWAKQQTLEENRWSNLQGVLFPGQLSHPSSSFINMSTVEDSRPLLSPPIVQQSERSEWLARSQSLGSKLSWG